LPENGLEALKRACRYAFITNKKEYCGAQDAFKSFQAFLEKPSEQNANTVRSLFPSFEGLYAYLTLIAHSNGRDPLDSEVIEAYWIGNALLDAISLSQLQRMIRDQLGAPRLLPKRVAEEKASKLKESLFPNHAFHVLYINFMTSKVAPIQAHLNNCLIHAGRVESIHDENLTVKGTWLSVNERGFSIGEMVREVQQGRLPNPREGDWISIHWNEAVETLSFEEVKRLQYYTDENMQRINRVRFP